MTASPPESAQRLPALKRSAILMVLLGEQASAEILRELSDEDVRRLSQEVAKVRRIPPDLAETVIEEFYQMSMARQYVRQGGLDYAKAVLVKAFGPDAAKRWLDLLMKSAVSQPANLDILQRIDPQQLARFVYGEHPQTIALVLSHLSPDKASQLLSSLPPELRPDVLLRVARLDQIAPDVLHRVVGVIGQKIKNLGEYSRESCGGVKAVAELCNRLDSVASKEILDRVEEQDKVLADKIRRLMFVFDDLVKIDDGGMKELLSKLDRKLLTLALKGTSDQIRSRFTQFMSQRAVEMLNEDMEALGPVKVKDVEAAQQQIIGVVRKLEQEGAISLRGAGEEQYVN